MSLLSLNFHHFDRLHHSKSCVILLAMSYHLASIRAKLSYLHPTHNDGMKFSYHMRIMGTQKGITIP